MSGERWALYFAPDSGSDLAQVGAAILGRDAESGRELEQPALPGVLPERFAQLTESPRRYGLHATLKAPFRLAEGRSAADLSAAVRRFAARTAAVDIPGLRLERLGFFLALAPAVACPAIRILAAACVAEFDGFRAPAPPEELERRRTAGLTPGQETMLRRWGYPFVMDEFQFHISLTGVIRDPGERGRVQFGLEALTQGICHRPVFVNTLCLFRQDAPDAAFRLAERVPLGN